MKIKVSYGLLIALAMMFPVDIAAAVKPYKGNHSYFDYIIVGFGAAGAILARKLSDDFNTSVLVLEAGENKVLDPVVLSPDPEAFEEELAFNPTYSVTYPVLAPEGAILYSEGRTWGGGAAHNDMQAVRPNQADTVQWATAANNAQWLYPNILPKMIALETYTPDGTVANPTQRGTSGPIGLTQNPSISSDPLAIAIANVAAAPFTSDYNNALLSNVSTGPIQLFTAAGVRRSFSAYDFMTIGSIIDNQGRGLNGRKVRVRSNCTVTRIIFEGTTAAGVQYLQHDADRASEQVKKVYACQNVILCAGAINSPKILMLSGVGDAQALNDLGIDVVVDNPNVGAHLTNQYGAMAMMSYTSEIPGGQIASFIDERPYMPADNVRRMQLIGMNASETQALLAGLILKPSSEGSVTLVSKDPLTQPKVSMNMYTDGSVTDVGSDAYKTVSFLKLAKAIATAAGSTVLYPTAAQYTAGDEALLEAAQSPSSLVIAYHNVGTTRMGTSIANSVVDGNLRVHGTNHLMVADIGVLPTSPSGNPCYSAYVVAMRAAEALGVATPPAL